MTNSYRDNFVGEHGDGGAVEKPFFKETFSINLLSPPGRGMR